MTSIARKNAPAIGLGWGGSRVGNGLKPAVLPSEGDPQPVSLELPPDDLSVMEASFWKDYAGLAIERKTLTVATVPAFRLLCELHAKKTMLSKAIDKGAVDALRHFMQLAKQIETLMARFCLAPFGKPAVGEKPKAKANPWATLGGKP